MATAEVEVELEFGAETEINVDESRAACESCFLNGNEKALGECALVAALAPVKRTVVAESVVAILRQASEDSFTTSDVVATYPDPVIRSYIQISEMV